MELPPNYRASIVEGDTIMDLSAYIIPPHGGVTLFFKVDDDGKEDQNSFDYFAYDDIPYFVCYWSQRFLSEQVSALDYSQRRRARLAAWEETICYHIERVLQKLLVPDASNLHHGVAFKMDFLSTSPQAMESLGLSADCGGTGSTGGNLLKRIRLCDDGVGWRKDDGCAICFEEFEEERCDRKEDLTCMPCLHAFHYTCLEDWLPRSLTCPMCRHELNWKIVLAD